MERFVLFVIRLTHLKLQLIQIDVRDPRSGDVLLKLSAPNKIIGLLVTDYRGSGLTDLVCVTEHGEGWNL